ncbi:hypothetical protein [Sinomonas terrae]|uniref:Uncharacterized protein n=1 Tax=Sinomonas terrae TaxID=2908838 RepID=A0ABS9U1D3_9MICC|nr:hypothetical protein [Sinomonas terrae]MCH6470140.1 hypothetical protein [Sinomonas terrae]HKU10266.1 hypothetical protein [Sinomonas sp.]
MAAIIIGVAAIVALGVGSWRLRSSQPQAARALATGTGAVICAEGIAMFALPGLLDPYGPDWGKVLAGVVLGAFGFFLARFIWRSYSDVAG